MTPKAWIQELVDYLDGRFGAEPGVRNSLVERAYKSRAWEHYKSPLDWADEWSRDRYPEE